jgi:hypothetical protein
MLDLKMDRHKDHILQQRIIHLTSAEDTTADHVSKINPSLFTVTYAIFHENMNKGVRTLSVLVCAMVKIVAHLSLSHELKPVSSTCAGDDPKKTAEETLELFKIKVSSRNGYQ